MANALLRAVQAGAVDPEELRQLLESLGPGETLDPNELANVLGGAGTQRIDRGDQVSRGMDRQNALLRATYGDTGDQPSRYSARLGVPEPDLGGGYGDQPSRTMQRGPESPLSQPPRLQDLPTDQLRDVYHPNAGGFVRNETTGKTLFVNGQPGGISEEPYGQAQGQGGGSPMADLMAKFQGAKAGAMPNPDAGYLGTKRMRTDAGPGMMRVIGSGNGTTVDLGTEPDQAVPIDYSRGKREIPGVGIAYYGKDGNAYIPNGDGTKTKVLLGYDMQGSMALNRAEQQRQLGQAQIEHAREQTRASQVNNPDMNAPGTPMGDATRSGLRGDELLKTIDPATASIVKQMVEGRAPPPNGMAMRNPRVMQILAIANQYDPTFDATTWAERYKTAQDFSSGGKSGQTLTAFNTALEHLDRLDKSGKALGNRFLVPWNSVANTVEQALGDPRIVAFQADKDALTGELTKAFNSGHITDTQLAKWGGTISSASSPEQLQAAYKEFVGLLGSKINEMGNTYRRSMGRGLDPSTFMSPQASAVFNRFHGGPEAPQGQAPNASAGATKRVTSQADYDGLRPGEQYVAPDGSMRTKR